MKRFDTTTSARSRWSDISVLVSLLICMSSSFSPCRATLVLASPSFSRGLALSVKSAPPLSVVKRRCFLSDQINPGLLAVPRRVPSRRPHRALLACPPIQGPLLLECGSRLIESLPSAFCAHSILHIACTSNCTFYAIYHRVRSENSFQT